MPKGNDEPFGKAPEISVGVSDAVLLLVSGIGFVLLSVTMYSIIIARLKSREEIEEEEKDLKYEDKLANADVATLNRAQRRARAKHIMKQQRRIAPNRAIENEDGENHDEPIQNLDPSIRHLSRKERQKAAKAAEKEERTLFEEERRRQHQEALEEAQREKKERERRLAEKAEVERRVRKEQRQSEELAAYEDWKRFLASPDLSKSLTVREWVKELENDRMVHVNQLAERFQVSTAEVVSRIQELVASFRVTGVLEADGRFIYVSKEEMSSIASFVKTQDKVSLLQLADQISLIISN